MRILGIIPARFASSRLPGKPLLDIGGLSMLQRVYARAAQARTLDRVVVATDDQRVYAHAESFGAHVVMTSPDHPSGTDRSHEAWSRVADGHEGVVNIQGDEPFLDPEQIDLLGEALQDPGTGIVTLAKAITADEELDDPGEAHVVVDKDMNALYFSRAAIPFLRDRSAGPRHAMFPFLKHVGIYGYRASVLERIVGMPPSALERAEHLEQLRWLENGFRVRVVRTENDSFCVDTEADLAEARRRVKAL
ncbi:MAG: 3-deoxy-manno-octulosonate cytidylyltransferase [Flavobacteriales bacterium]|nr:3-deoxy-manno-octulosonate cytidylyltransferase [Flavobacteriales bacterium]MCB9193438.1 3-deoxy-manno-octulosonate cytidylyltransferase [Flavobacteriales bacterium]